MELFGFPELPKTTKEKRYKKLAKLLLDIPTNTFFYAPLENIKKIDKYYRILVNFREEETLGIVVDILEDVSEKELDGYFVSIKEVLDEEAIITDFQYSLAQWISYFYAVPLPSALFLFIPKTKRKKIKILSEEQVQKLIEIASRNYNIKLTDSQQNIANSILENIDKYGKYLIFGITGSGKTEIYKFLTLKLLEKGKGVIILVPEIILTPQFLQKFSFIPTELISVYHSKLTENERLNEWLAILRGSKRVVIGPRSSVFTPVKNLGMIIIDEVQESSYKSSSEPKYHALEIAEEIARRLNIPLVVGTATPPVDLFYKFEKGEGKIFELKERYGGAELPETIIIDMRKEKDKRSTVSVRLFNALLETINQKKQAILFINRRGYAPAIKCLDCGNIIKCPNCEISMTYHKDRNILECHHCGYTMKVPKQCPHCESMELIPVGIATEKVVEIISNMLPNINIKRVDLDTMRRKYAYDEFYKIFRSGELNIVVGTQIVAKGLDIPTVKLVGIVSADTTLSIPDFRANERTFILITQVIGRAGRIEGEKGLAIVQTHNPEHYAIKYAVLQDFRKFYEEEMKYRERFLYPPFVTLLRLIIKGEKEKRVKSIANLVSVAVSKFVKTEDIVMLGPTPCPYYKIANNYRYHIIWKHQNRDVLIKLANYIKDSFKNLKDVKLEVDFNPYSLL